MKINYSIVLMILLLGLTYCAKEEKVSSVPYSKLNEKDKRLPAHALNSFEVFDGMEVSMFASEPMLVNPTNMAIDEKGRIWVCEATNYRLFRNKQYDEKQEGDRILILEDTDGDGKADLRKVFYQGKDINSALGIAVFDNKVIISVSPNVWIFTDEDGDDQPDRKELLFTGIGGEDHDHGVHAFVFGPDGKLYFNFGNNGGQLQDKNGEPVLDQYGQAIQTGGKPYRQGVAFRCNLDGSEVEVLAHNFRNPFELCVDAFGTIWQSDNDDDGNQGTRINYVMEDGNFGFRDAITGANWRAYRVSMDQEIPRRHWHQNDPGVVPNLLFTGAGSPTGICMYESDLLPTVFENQMLHCEPLKNVVRTYPVQKDGAGYTAEVVNLLQSEDAWFRPSDVTIAPDGSIFVTDWYDAGVGGHKMDDIDRGRIYRIAPKGLDYDVPTFDFSSVNGLLSAFENANQSVRYLAWQGLIERGVEAIPGLKSLWEAKDLRLRARALWLLTIIDSENTDYLDEALADQNEDIRITAIRIIKNRFPNSLSTTIYNLIEDPSSAVKRELALALRDIGNEQAAQLWARLAHQYEGSDRWYLEALGIGADRFSDLYFDTWAESLNEKDLTASQKDIIWRIHTDHSINFLTKAILQSKADTNEMPKLFRAFHFKPEHNRNSALEMILTNGDQTPLTRRLAVYHLDWKQIAPQSPLYQKVKTIMPAIQGSMEWLTAVKAMEAKEYLPDILKLFVETNNDNLSQQAGHLLLDLEGATTMATMFEEADLEQQQMIVKKLGRVNHSDALMMLKDWLKKDYPIVLKTSMIPAIARMNGGEAALLEMLEQKKLTEHLKNTAALRLMNSWNTDISGKAKLYVDRAKTRDGKSLPQIYELAQLQGDETSGRKVFNTYCATCHQINGQGIEFGPDLSKIGEKLAKEALYSSIIYPSAGINFGYEGYRVHTQGDTFYSGYIINETENELTLKLIGGLDQTINKEVITKIEAIEQSLMTPNLHEVMAEQELIDLVTFLTTLK